MSRIEQAPQKIYDRRGKVAYSLMPGVFYDNDGDGRGDLMGIAEKMSYIGPILGADEVHINPFFESPEHDAGYDVAHDYKINPKFGGKEGFEALVAAGKESGVKIVMDVVPNHTSDQHPDFIASKNSPPDSPERDLYIWRRGKPDGSPPNNWESNFGGPAWTYCPEIDPPEGMLYFHEFLSSQPDRNQDNPVVREKIKNIMRFWAEKGISGFRLDSILYAHKAEGMGDAIPNPDFIPGVSHPSQKVINDYKWFQPEMLEYQHEYAEFVKRELPGVFLFGESNPPRDKKNWIPRLYASAPGDVHAVINSTPIGLPWNADAQLEHAEEFFSMLRPEDIAVSQFNNHDETRRSIDKLAISHPGNADEQARNLALYQLSLPGYQLIYYGDEIGMKGQEVPYDPDNPLQNHPFRKNGYEKTKDPNRLPMCWDDSENAGFTRGNPLMPIPVDYKTRNVKTELQDPASLLNLYRRLIKYRRQSEALQNGHFKRTDTYNNAVGAYRLESESGDLKGGIINFSDKKQSVSLDISEAKVIIASQIDIRPGEVIDLTRYEMLPNQAILFSPNNK
jgi:alpha-glucosidase